MFLYVRESLEQKEGRHRWGILFVEEIVEKGGGSRDVTKKEIGRLVLRGEKEKVRGYIEEN